MQNLGSQPNANERAEDYASRELMTARGQHRSSEPLAKRSAARKDELSSLLNAASPLAATSMRSCLNPDTDASTHLCKYVPVGGG